MKYIFRLAGSFFFAFCVATAAQAKTYPDKPINIIVPFSPGGVTDVMARLVAAKLQDILDNPVVVLNKPGAGTMIATRYAAKSPADGYTILMAASSFAVAPSLYKNAGYDPHKEFDAVSLIAAVPHVLVVNQENKATDVASLISQLKAEGADGNYASSGMGASNHLEGELFASLAGLDLVHVPFGGGAPAMTSLTGGEIDFMFVDLTSAKPFIDSGRAKVLAVTTKERSALMPDVPTVEESGLENFDASPWLGLVVPAGTPASVVETLDNALQKIKDDTAVNERLASLGLEAKFSNAADFSEFMLEDSKKWDTVIEQANISLD